MMNACSPRHRHRAAAEAFSAPAAEVEAVIRFLADRLETAAARMPARWQPILPEALFNLAARRLLAERGALPTAWALRCLADLIAGQEPGHDGTLPGCG